MSARLRKTFHYPNDGGDSEPDELDEQDQDTLIQDLQASDESATIFYRRAFLALPLVSALVYFPVILTANSFRQVLLALLSLTSLASTAYVLHYLQPAPQSTSSARPALVVDGRSPLDKALPFLNAVLSALLALAAILAWRRNLIDEAWRGFLPAAVFLVVMYARSQLAPLDVAGLERLKYNYKGA